MFNVQIRLETLETFIDVPQTLVDEAKVHFYDDGIEITAQDPASVAMVNISLPAEATESYTCSSDDSLDGEGDGDVIGLVFESLDDVLGLGEDDDIVSMHPNNGMLDIDIGGIDYQQALADINYLRAEPDVSDLDLGSRVELSGEQFTGAVAAGELVSDHIRFTVDDADGDGAAPSFVAEADGDTNSIEREFGSSDLGNIVATGADTLLSLDYLGDISSVISDDDHVDMRIDEEMPADFKITPEDTPADVRFIVAPRIDAE